MFKLIVTDLDGTLLKTDKTISDFTKDILSNCREKGIKIAYATGRGNPHLILPSEMFDGRIVANGAQCFVNEKAVYECFLSAESARPLLLACHWRGLKTASQFGDWHYANHNPNTAPQIAKTDNIQIVDFNTHNIDATKVYAWVNTQDDISFIKTHLPEDAWLSVSRDGLAMVMHQNATKAKALVTLARHWNIDASEIIAFGDDHNDLDLLAYAGIGVAMGNALKDVKAASDVVCDTNDNDGVARWIEKQLV